MHWKLISDVNQPVLHQKFLPTSEFNKLINFNWNYESNTQMLWFISAIQVYDVAVYQPSFVEVSYRGFMLKIHTNNFLISFLNCSTNIVKSKYQKNMLTYTAYKIKIVDIFGSMLIYWARIYNYAVLTLFGKTSTRYSNLLCCVFYPVLID